MIIEDRNHLPQEMNDIPDAKLALAQVDYTTDERFTTEPIGFYKDAFRRLRANKVSMISLCTILEIGRASCRERV